MNKGLNEFLKLNHKNKITREEARELHSQVFDLIVDDENFEDFGFYSYDIGGLCNEFCDDKYELKDGGLSRLFNRNDSISTLLKFTDKSEELDYDLKISTWHDSGCKVYEVKVSVRAYDKNVEHYRFFSIDKIIDGSYRMPKDDEYRFF